MTYPVRNPLLGYNYDVKSFGMDITRDSTDHSYFELTEIEFLAKRNGAKSNNERILYEKKLSDLHAGIVDAIDIKKTGYFFPRTLKHITPNILEKCTPKYITHRRKFHADFINDADFSLGRNNANLYLRCNEFGIDTLRVLDYINNPPIELEMKLYGFLRKPEYTEKYVVLVKQMNNIRAELAVRKHTPELTVDIKRRVAEYTRQAKKLNADKSYLLSIEERFKTHYAPCGSGIAELAIAEYYRDTGTQPVELRPQRPESVREPSNRADYRHRHNMLPA